MRIEDPNLTFLDRIDSPHRTNPIIYVLLINDTSQWPLFVQWWHTHWIITNTNLTLSFIINELISVCYVTEKVSRCV